MKVPKIRSTFPRPRGLPGREKNARTRRSATRPSRTSLLREIFRARPRPKPSNPPTPPVADIHNISRHIELADGFSLDPRERFTVWVILGQAPKDKDKDDKEKDKDKDKKTTKINYQGKLPGGGIIAEQPRYHPSTRSLVFGILTILSAAAVAVTLLLSPATTTTTAGPPPCPKGNLVLEGSTAFTPTANTLEPQFLRSCHNPRTTVTVTGLSSITALNALIATVRQNPQAANYQIVMSDGPAPAGRGYRGLIGTPIGVIIFTVVVNQQTGVYNLTTSELRKIFTGVITNWRQLGGPDLPVYIVSRDFGSGSRRAFDQYVLGPATPEPQVSSYNCTDKVNPAAKVTLCEEPGTPQLLQEVAGLPGAIGYAQTWDVTQYQGTNIQPVELNGIPDTFGNLGASKPGAGKHGTYQFWTVEYLYTYGTPPPNSLAAAFLAFMNSSTAKNLLPAGGYTPCTHQPQLCASGAR